MIEGGGAGPRACTGGVEEGLFRGFQGLGNVVEGRCC